MGILRETLRLTAEMAPYLLLGFLFAGLLRAFLSPESVKRRLGRRGLSSVVKAALLGVPLPLCSCGVIGPATGLRRSGASRGATLSFLISTPTTGVDSLLATYSLLGLGFALARALAASLLAVVAGLLADLWPDEGNGDGQPNGEEVRGLSGRLRAGLRYALLELPGDIGKWLVVGLLAGGVISYAVQPGLLAPLKNPFLAYVGVLAIAVPTYVCAVGSIPVAAALVAKGLGLGPALAFLIAGPATNTVTLGVVGKLLGKRSLAIYLAVIVLGSIALGLGLDWLAVRVPALGQLPPLSREPGPLGWGAAIVLAGILVWGLVVWPLWARRKPKGLITIRVKGMGCQGCVLKVKNALSDLNLAELRVEVGAVRFRGGDPERVAERIREAGYEPVLPEGR